MNEILINIFNFLKLTWKRQKYVYRFIILNGTEENKQLKISNSIEYEFINSGNSYVILNSTLILYPAFMGIEPSRIKFTTNKNEVDIGVYNYEFRAIANNDPVKGFAPDAALPNYNILAAYLG